MKKSIQKIFDSELYIFLMFMLSTLVWTFRIDYHIYFPIIAIIVVLFSFTCTYSKPLIPILCSVSIANIFNYRLGDKNVTDILAALDMKFIIAIVVIIVLSLLYFYIRNRQTYGKVSRIGLSLVAIFIAFALTDNLVVKSYNYLVIGLLVILFYFLRHTTDYYQMKGEFLPYISKTMFYMALTISCECFIYYLRNFTLDSSIGFIPEFGWGNSNNGAMLMLLIIPIASYSLFYTKNNWYFIGLLIFITTIFLTTSRGAILSLIILVPLILLNYFRKYHSRRDFFRGLFITILFFLALFVLFQPYFIKVLHMLFFDGLNDSGRFDLWRQAVETFKNSPIFGGGTSFIPHNGNLKMHWFHSTFFDIIGQLGLVGLFAYGLHFFFKYRTIFTDRSTYKWFVLPGFLASGAYAMIDCCYWNFMYLFTYVIILASLEYSSGYFSHHRND